MKIKLLLLFGILGGIFYFKDQLQEVDHIPLFGRKLNPPPFCSKISASAQWLQYRCVPQLGEVSSFSQALTVSHTLLSQVQDFSSESGLSVGESLAAEESGIELQMRGLDYYEIDRSEGVLRTLGGAYIERIQEELYAGGWTSGEEFQQSPQKSQVLKAFPYKQGQSFYQWQQSSPQSFSFTTDQWEKHFVGGMLWWLKAPLKKNQFIRRSLKKYQRVEDLKSEWFNHCWRVPQESVYCEQFSPVDTWGSDEAFYQVWAKAQLRGDKIKEAFWERYPLQALQGFFSSFEDDHMSWVHSLSVAMPWELFPNVVAQDVFQGDKLQLWSQCEALANNHPFHMLELFWGEDDRGLCLVK